GGRCRISEVIAVSGARVREVGTTNRTRVADYENAIGPETALILRVHQSNFRTVGFSERPALKALAAVAERAGVPLVDDLGSGSLVPIGDQPPVPARLARGAGLVTLSRDTLPPP